MKILINDKKKIFEIQKEFNDAFPYLQIQFFSAPHRPGGGSPKTKMLDSKKNLGDFRTKHNKGKITITAAMTVKELEQNFHEVFGLSIQVFRKSGKIWLETNVTDDWTLEEQNTEGESLSRPVRPPRISDLETDSDIY
jgi:hypothetical protein